MNDVGIVKKKRDEKDGARGSLVSRIFLISLFLVALPLFFHTLWMYQKEYKEKKKDLLITLKILGETRAENFEQWIAFQKKSLDEVASNINFDQELIQLTPLEPESNLFYLLNEKDHLICKGSTDPSLLGKEFPSDPNFLTDLYSGAQSFLGTYKRSIFIVHLIKKDHYLVFQEPVVNVIKTLLPPKDFPYPVDISFIVDSNEPFLSKDTLKKTDLNNPFLVTTGKEIGETLFIKVPVKGTSFFLLLGLSEKTIIDLHKKEYVFRIFSLIFLILILGGGSSYFLVRRIYIPLKDLLSVMDRVYQGDFRARYHKDRMGFEINVLGIHFNQMIEAIVLHQKQVEKERIQKERYKEQLLIGKEIQANLLPTKLPHIKGVVIEPFCQPALEVGGDFYDLFFKEDQLMFCIADISGKGISACLFSLSIRSILRSFLSTEEDFKKALIQANQVFCLDTDENGMFATSWVGYFNPSSRVLTYCNLGHFPALLKRADNTILELTTHCMALGLKPFSDLEIGSITLKKGDILLLYTDGVIDMQNLQKEHFGKERLMAFFEKNNSKDPKKISEELQLELRSFSQYSAPYDDLTLLVFYIE